MEKELNHPPINFGKTGAVSYTHLRAHETNPEMVENLIKIVRDFK